MTGLFRRWVLLPLMLGTLFPLAVTVQAAEVEALAPGMVNPGYQYKPGWFKESFLDIREDVAESTGEGRRVLLYFYQDGCPYCAKLLRENFSMHHIVEKTRSGFDVIAINMWGDREVINQQGKTVTEKQFARDLKVMFTPTLLFLNEDAAVLLRINGYYPPQKFVTALDFVAGKHETTSTYREYYARHASAASGKLHLQPEYLQPPYHLARKAGARPLLVLFEQKQCEPCDALHLDILQRKASVELTRQFDVVLLNMWSREPIVTPTGQTTTVRRWADALDIKFAPSMVFFDSQGAEVFRIEAWLKAFHIQSSMDYVLSGAYRTEPEFQRYIAGRAEALEAQGNHIDLMH